MLHENKNNNDNNKRFPPGLVSKKRVGTPAANFPGVSYIIYTIILDMQSKSPARIRSPIHVQYYYRHTHVDEKLVYGMGV